MCLAHESNWIKGPIFNQVSSPAYKTISPLSLCKVTLWDVRVIQQTSWLCSMWHLATVWRSKLYSAALACFDDAHVTHPTGIAIHNGEKTAFPRRHWVGLVFDKRSGFNMKWYLSSQSLFGCQVPVFWSSLHYFWHYFCVFQAHYIIKWKE